jgi:Response regulator receiver domain
MAQTDDKSRSTILVVDDKEAVLALVQTILKNEGFRVLIAKSGRSAVKLASEYPDEIDLLLSDIEMPGMTGPQLGIELKKSRPDVHVMLMSGLPGGDLLVLNYGWAFHSKTVHCGKARRNGQCGSTKSQQVTGQLRIRYDEMRLTSRGHARRHVVP